MDIINDYLVDGLLLVPVVASLLSLLLKDGTARKVITYFFAAIIALGSLVLVGGNIGTGYIEISVSESFVEIAKYVGIAISAVIAITIISYAIKYKNFLALFLALFQFAGSLHIELIVEERAAPTSHLYLNSLTLLMVFIIGVIGSGICVYALGYMSDHNKHLEKDQKDRSNKFFSLMFIFLSAMFVIVFSNNMIWMFTGWEVTTLCSFLLIGYTKTGEAIKNSFRQINMNLLGGIAFAGAMYLSATNLNTLEFSTFITNGITDTANVALPACLLAFAAITKAAQMPFQSWLLGAMVAPTPTSALLHSSTMVKAGVFLLVKLSPIFFVSLAPQLMVMLVGGVTFLLCSFMAISQTNAKRVLAYSTIANLGLIVACAGIGSPEAIWSAMFLILFHACAKSLLFLCVGTAEHHIGSRDIEDMDGLFLRMPRLARFMMVGMMAMFIAPFGMLISKWAAFASFIDANQIVLIIILAFGSAATFMFWAKWLGKLSGIVANSKNVEVTVHKSEWISQIIMLIVIFVSVVFMPLISDFVAMPYIYEVYNNFGQYGLYYAMYSPYMSQVNIVVCCISAIVMFLVLFIGVGRNNKAKQANIYLAGASVDNDSRTFLGSMNVKTKAVAKNMYLDFYFGEKRIAPIGNIVNIIIFVVAAVLATLVTIGIL